MRVYTLSSCGVINYYAGIPAIGPKELRWRSSNLRAIMGVALRTGAHGIQCVVSCIAERKYGSPFWKRYSWSCQSA